MLGLWLGKADFFDIYWSARRSSVNLIRSSVTKLYALVWCPVVVITLPAMPLINLLHALVTGAATFGINPVLPPVPITPKSAGEAFAEDASKLKGDFDTALENLKSEVQSGGQSITTKAGG